MYRKSLENKKKMFAVAPMMDWTDRHCRYLHRLLTKQALLYTEMVTANAVIHGDRNRLIGYNEAEHPLALQLGGSNPEALKAATKVAADFRYGEINLNVGCPSDRVKSGTFGACLMEKPNLVAECIGAMKEAINLPVTVKCRIGVDDQDPEKALDALADAVCEMKVDAIWVHARKAWLQGLSPKENRDIPPLDYDRVYRLKERLPNKFIGINGGIENLEACVEHLSHVDGVMLGRAAYHNASLLRDVDRVIYGDENPPIHWGSVASTMADYCEAHLQTGGKLMNVTRHMIGLFSGIPGARRYRQILSEEARGEGATPEIILKAFSAVDTSQLDIAA